MARGHSKAIKRARRLIYLEDQAGPPRWPGSSPMRSPTTPSCTWWSSCPEYRTRTAPSPSGRSLVAAGRRSRCASAGGPGARVRRGEPPGHAGLRAREGAWPSTPGPCGERQLQPPLVDARQRAVQRVLDTTRDPRSPLDPGGEGYGARTFARDLRLPSPASTSISRTTAPRTTRCWTPTGSSDPRRARRRHWTPGTRRPPGSASARPTAPAPGGTTAAVHAAVGDPGLPDARRPRWPPDQAPAEEELLTPGLPVSRSG